MSYTSTTNNNEIIHLNHPEKKHFFFRGFQRAIKAMKNYRLFFWIFTWFLLSNFFVLVHDCLWLLRHKQKKRSPQERKLLKNRKKAHKVPIGVISHFFTVNNFFISTPSERSFSPDVVYTCGISWDCSLGTLKETPSLHLSFLFFGIWWIPCPPL